MIMKQKLHLFLTFNREMLGPELTFVHLTMGFEDKRKRLMKRHEGGETFVEIMEVIKHYEEMKIKDQMMNTHFFLI